MFKFNEGIIFQGSRFSLTGSRAW